MLATQIVMRWIRMFSRVEKSNLFRITPATTGDRVLAGVLTTVFSIGGVGFAAWLSI
jgi:hypothetical protein